MQARKPAVLQAIQARAFSENDPSNSNRPKRRSMFGKLPTIKKDTQETSQDAKPVETEKPVQADAQHQEDTKSTKH
jgi:hypothetical protein